jgi:hypothetical protein
VSEKIEVGDIRGDLVSVGDTIAYAVREGNTAALRVGTVLEIVPKPKTYTTKLESSPYKLRVQVEWDNSLWGVPDKPSLIDANLRRFVKVGE